MMGLKCKLANTELQSAAHAERLLTLTAGDNVVRLLPPLIISDDDLSDGVERLHHACRKLETKRG
jgi:acetylornithine/N-succinyldiaminopimelate aminotransferase